LTTPYRKIGFVDPGRVDTYTEKIVRNEKRNCFVVTETLLLIEARGKAPALVFVRRKLHAQLLADMFRERTGLHVPVVTADMPDAEREQLRIDINEGHQQLAVCTSVWSTGVDIPNLKGLVLAGGGEAPIGLIQTVGRAVRKKEGEFEVIDIADEGIPRYEQQAERRTQHLLDEGYQIEGVNAATDLLRATRDPEPEPIWEEYAPVQQELPPQLTVGQFFHTALSILFLVGVCVGALLR
jgi:superfamily II DNA or RNA helicase